MADRNWMASAFRSQKSKYFSLFVQQSTRNSYENTSICALLLVTLLCFEHFTIFSFNTSAKLAGQFSSVLCASCLFKFFVAIKRTFARQKKSTVGGFPSLFYFWALSVHVCLQIQKLWYSSCPGSFSELSLTFLLHGINVHADRCSSWLGIVCFVSAGVF